MLPILHLCKQCKVTHACPECADSRGHDDLSNAMCLDCDDENMKNKNNDDDGMGIGSIDNNKEEENNNDNNDDDEEENNNDNNGNNNDNNNVVTDLEREYRSRGVSSKPSRMYVKWVNMR